MLIYTFFDLIARYVSSLMACRDLYPGQSRHNPSFSDTGEAEGISSIYLTALLTACEMKEQALHTAQR
jgi:hypothetical protein